jgi:hypothetical protein
MANYKDSYVNGNIKKDKSRREQRKNKKRKEQYQSMKMYFS